MKKVACEYYNQEWTILTPIDQLASQLPLVQQARAVIESLLKDEPVCGVHFLLLFYIRYF
jgi:hypothetical protein